MGFKAYAGQGTVYMASIDADGNLTSDFRQVGTAYPLSVQVKTDQIKKKSRMVENAGQVIAARTKIADDGITGSLTLHEWNAANLAWALSGSAVALTAESGTVESESVIAPAAGAYKDLTHEGVSNVVVKDATDATTYVAGTDYTVETTLGLITIIESGSISEGDTLHVGYTYAAKSGYQVDIGSNVTIRVAIKAHLYDEFRGTHHTMELDSVVLASNTEINFISEEDSTGEELQFGMTLETLSGRTSPGRVNGIPM
ncbi:MAG: hypothetical protein AB7U29_03470 [Desulfobulbus sp.]